MMADRFARFGLPAFFALGLLLGGSAQGLWGKLLLEFVAVAVMAATVWVRRDRALESSDRFMLAMIGLVVLLVAFQILPLPPALWSALPGRAPIAAGFALLGQSLPWAPVSLAPSTSLSTALTLLPAVAMLMAVLWFPHVRRGSFSLVLVGVALANILLGTLQVSNTGDEAHWYLYPDTNLGAATGFFANANHLAILLVTAVPFLAALVMRMSRNKRDRRSAGLAGAGLGGLLLLLLGILLSGSIAATVLMLPALLGAAALVLKPSRTTRLTLLGLALAVGAGAVAVMLSGGVPAGMRGANKVASFDTRAEFAHHTVGLIPTYMPVGSGLGTFPTIYPTSENPNTVTLDFVNHAHDDYLELALETGLPGLLLVVLFVGWWAWRTVVIWRSAAGSGHARAATIASGVLLLHSIVDYPLRTIAIEMVFAYCVALMALPLTQAAAAEEGGEARHLRIG
ncbi:O-antigen ligase family protein [Sphingomonas ginkgonis]|nr:O-antigen ligase family protein [Sphingomonas ginkgonis]